MINRIFRNIKYQFLETIGLREKINFKKTFNQQERILIKVAIKQERQTFLKCLMMECPLISKEVRAFLQCFG